MLHLIGCLYYLYQWCTVKQKSDNEIYLLIKYTKSVLWRVAKCLSYIEEARCLKVKHITGNKSAPKWKNYARYKWPQDSLLYPVKSLTKRVWKVFINLTAFHSVHISYSNYIINTPTKCTHKIIYIYYHQHSPTCFGTHYAIFRDNFIVSSKLLP